MAKPVISVIIPIRNRTGLRLENALRSLRRQSVPAGEVEILLSDFGSDNENAALIEQLASSYNARVVRTDTDEIWNRSRAINIALQHCTAPVSFCTDADMVFQDNFLQVILDKFAPSKPTPMVVCRCRDLPDMGAERLYEKSDVTDLLAASTIRQAMGTGACQVAPTEWFRKVRGYDEKYIFWGFEDKDMYHRAQVDGLVITWIHDETAMLHQWHRTTKGDRAIRKQLNKMRYYLTRHIVVKNRRQWGNE